MRLKNTLGLAIAGEHKCWTDAPVITCRHHWVNDPRSIFIYRYNAMPVVESV